MKLKKHDFLMLSLLLITGLGSWWTNYNRTAVGFFTSDTWIFWDGFFYTLFSALLVGYVISRILKGK